MLPSGFKLLHVHQEISEVNSQGWVVRVEAYRLCIGGARGGTMTGANGQGRQIAERARAGGVAADDAQIEFLRRVVLRGGCEATRTIEQIRDG
jgi:hypothetical protein